MDRELYVRIKNKSDTYENWINNNPVLYSGEIVYDSTNKKIKVGDGVSQWSSLPYYSCIDESELQTMIQQYVEQYLLNGVW